MYVRYEFLFCIHLKIKINESYFGMSSKILSNNYKFKQSREAKKKKKEKNKKRWQHETNVTKKKKKKVKLEIIKN